MLRRALVLAALASLPAAAFAVSSVFVYQGELRENNARANGSYDLQFALQTSAGVPVGAPLLHEAVPVADGRFSVELDFGASITGADFQLQIGVRPDASNGAFTPLLPATALRPTPQAQVAGPRVQWPRRLVGGGLHAGRTEDAARGAGVQGAAEDV